MYKSHTVLDLNLIYIFEFELKHSLTSFNIFFFVIKTHIINLIYIILIKIRFNIFMCFLFSTYFIIFLQGPVDSKLDSFLKQGITHTE